jgi:nucleoside-diphosphate-sugar epimerase
VKILVTGACGGVGSHLVPRLLSLGHTVIAIDDLSSGSWDSLVEDSNLTCITADISDRVELTKKLLGFSFDFIFHLAAISSLPECEVDPERAYLVNLIGTVNLVELSRQQAGFWGFVFTSTSAVYEATSEYPYREDSRINPKLIYPMTKSFAESFLKAQFSNYNFPSTILRLFNIFGDFQSVTRQSPPVLNYIVRELLTGRSPVLHSDGEQERDFVCVDDVIDALILTLNSESHVAEIFNVCRSQTLSVNQIFRAASEALESPLSVTYAPARDLWKGYPDLFSGNFALIPDAISREVIKPSLGSNEKFFATFGWRPTRDLISQIAEISIRIRARMTGIS